MLIQRLQSFVTKDLGPQPETKQQSKQKQCAGSLPMKKVKAVIVAKKALDTKTIC